MRENELEDILKEIGREEFAPAPDLVCRTKRRLRRSPLLPWALFGSLALQILAGCGTVLILSSESLGWEHKLYGFVAASLITGLFLFPLIAVRDQLSSFFGDADPAIEAC